MATATTETKQQEKNKETENKEMKNLIVKLAKVMASIGRLEKEGFNAFHNYKYFSADQLANLLRQKLASEGVIVFYQTEVLRDEEGVNHKGHRTRIVRVKLTGTFTDGEDSITVSSIGDGLDEGDKAIYKAITGAQKYLLRNTFTIGEGGEDPERDETVPTPATNDQPVAKKAVIPRSDKPNPVSVDDIPAWMAENKVTMAFLNQILTSKGIIAEPIKDIKDLDKATTDKVFSAAGKRRLLEYVANPPTPQPIKSEAPAPEKATPALKTRVPLCLQEEIEPQDVLAHYNLKTWKDVPIHFGDEKDLLLGDLSQARRRWFYEHFKAVPNEAGEFTDEDLLFDAGLYMMGVAQNHSAQ